LGQKYLGGGVFLGISPHYNPDASQIVFAGLADGSSEIFIYDMNLQKTHRLTNTSCWELDPVFLHSGKYIAFVSDKDTSDGEFYVMASDGSAVHRIAPGFTFRHNGIPQDGPHPAPLTDSFAFTAWDSSGHQGVFVYDNAKGTLQRISPADREDWYPIWSAMGTYVYFVESRDTSTRTPWDVIRVQMNGGKPETLFSGHETGIMGTTLDEKSVIVSQYGDDLIAKIYVASVADHWQLHLLGPSAGGGEWSAQANAMVFVDDSPAKFHCDLWRMDLAGTKQQITKMRGDLNEPAFSWDGRDIVFVGDKTGAPQNGFGKIYTVGANGNGFRMLCDTKN
jgi:Tol biopolymer transport system component